MSKNIRISPDQVRDAASKFNEGYNESMDMIKRLTGTMTNLMETSEGVTSDEIQQNFELWKKSMNDHAALLQKIDTALRDVADQFERFDRQKKILMD